MQPINLLKMYDEDEVSLLPPWIDYADLIDRESLSVDALQEVDGC